MLKLVNTTPFRARLVPGMDIERRDTLTVVIKGTFVPGADAVAQIAAEQAEVALADVHWGDPASSSVRYESDLAPTKPGTDVVLNGTAYAPRGGADALVVQLRAGPLSKAIRVLGTRYWGQDAFGRYRPSAPARFDSIPLTYENAFGGGAPAKERGAAPKGDPRNPVGAGWFAPGDAPTAESRVPHLEDPSTPLGAPGEQPAPACFGFVHRSWAPRAALAGTCDETWRKTRAPFLPLDFDPRHHLAASSGLSSSRRFVGGEPIHASHVRPGGLAFHCTTPTTALDVKVLVRGEDRVERAALDTVVVEPDAERILCTWRATFSVPRELLYVDRVKIVEV